MLTDLTSGSDAPIVNRVAESAIETLDLAALAPPAPVAFDLAPFLYKGVVLRERDFRQAVKEHDWDAYRDDSVAVFCSADALVPTWAYMLVAARLDGVAASVAEGTPGAVRQRGVVAALDGVDWERYRDAPVVVKGCGNDVVPLDAFVQVTRRLQGVASKVMYGEACSSVPVWRRPAPSPPAGAARPAGAKPLGVKPAGAKPAGPPR
ncbi:DUF2480 family protein [Rubrivirga sp. IMCC45206]|uniref:DUF2480 family protein n=1 Tax=Rubrivirga sp. IMCC45206 TaxID=3391614 RepID=UPI00398F9345